MEELEGRHRNSCWRRLGLRLKATKSYWSPCHKNGGQALGRKLPKARETLDSYTMPRLIRGFRGFGLDRIILPDV